MEIKVKDRTIGKGLRTFIVAEAACNHMCEMSLAKKMIDKAVESGADAIKFQTYRAEKLVTRDAVAFWGEETISQIDYYRRLDRFGREEYEELFNYAEERGVIAFSSPFDVESANMLNDLNMPLVKIASCEIPNIRFIKHVAAFGKPIFLSTGASELDEIDRAIKAIEGEDNHQVVIMACTLSYPTDVTDANLLRIQSLRERYPEYIIGFSDHTEPDENMIIPSIGVGLGARVIEKHYTLDRCMTGSGHFFAVDPDDLKKMVANIRLTESILGDGKLGVADSEKKAWNSARRSIVAEVLIRKGQIITEDMLAVKRPAGGLPADKIKAIVGKQAQQDIYPDQRISLDMICE